MYSGVEHLKIVNSLIPLCAKQLSLQPANTYQIMCRRRRDPNHNLQCLGDKEEQYGVENFQLLLFTDESQVTNKQGGVQAVN